LLIVSGLMIRTFIAMRQVDPGFTRPEEVQTFVLAIPGSLISDPQQAVRTFEGVVEQLARVPGVTSVGLSSSITMDGEDNGNYVAIEEFPDPEGTMVKLRRFKSIGPRYFETMGNRLVAGRSTHGTTSTSSGPSSSFPSHSRGSTGESRRRRSASASAAVRRDFRGARSSACPVTSSTMD
ncbi:MAG: hypothetical protein LC753_04920, partial [Acidobacteria bacterium]|nr:hypothetical protein [Acidobacteriota bacterium]